MLRTGNDVNAIIPLTMASADSSVAPYPVTTTASAPVRSSPTTHGEKLTRAPPFFIAEKISPANGSQMTAACSSPRNATPMLIALSGMEWQKFVVPSMGSNTKYGGSVLDASV